MRRTIIAGAAILFVMIALPIACQNRTVSSAHPTTTPAAQFSVLSYNVEFNHGTPTATIDAIAAADADVVCLQECNADWEKSLRAPLAERYREMRFENPPANDPGGLAILSKLPIESFTKLPHGDRGWFPACLAIVATPVGRVQILNVHLRPLISDSGSKLKGYFTVESMHRGEIESLHKKLDATMPTVIIGDFNEGNDGKAIKWLIDRGYIDALPRFDAKTPTWHGSVYGVQTSYRDDHVLVSKSLAAVDAQVLKQGASDHYPVRATITAAAYHHP